MASIAELSWTTSQDLLREVNLDTLYLRQVKAMGGDRFRDYPHLLLVHTGKIMIGISLGDSFNCPDPFNNSTGTRGQVNEDCGLSWKFSKEPWE